MDKKIEKILERIAARHRLDILWKGVGRPYHDCGLSPEHTLHCNEFCRSVKADPVRLKKCNGNDNRFIPVEAEKHQGPFFRRCHAGASELVVPYFAAGQCTEVLLLTVFREAGSSCPYEELRPLYDSLPLCQDEEFLETGLLLDDLMPVLRHYRESHRKRDGQIKDRRIREAAAIIRREFAAVLRPGGIAARICLSESRFIHLFKAETGSSFTGFLLNVRLEHSAGLLKYTDLTIREIMENSGFNDQSYFCVRFRKHTGCTPLEYRRRFAGSADI